MKTTSLRCIHFAAAALLVPVAMFGAGCGKKSSTTPSQPQGGDLVLGTSSVYSIPAGNGVTVRDTVTGATFAFPEGGGGALTITPIVSGQNIPVNGTAFLLGYPGADSVLLRVPGDGNYLVWGYGPIQATPDQDTTTGTDLWSALPPIDSTSGSQTYSLLLYSPGTGSAKQRVGSHPGFSRFWMQRLPVGSNEETRLLFQNQQVWQNIRRCLDSLPPALRAHADSAVNGPLRPRILLSDGNFYDGFGLIIPLTTPSVVPKINLRSDASISTIAHETGHFINHVLAGNAAYQLLQDQDPGPQHGIGAINAPRSVMLEEYAYFFDYFINGSVGGLWDPTNPRDAIRGLPPATTDIPSVEGVGCALLAACQRATGEIPNVFTGRMQKVPVVHLSFRRLFSIVASGAPTIDALRNAIEAEMTASEKLAMPALCHSIGWCYGVTGTIEDANHHGIAGLKVVAQSRVGNDCYYGDSTAVRTNSQGYFTIARGVFPGASTLLAITGTDTTELPLTIAYTTETTTPVNVGTFTIGSLNLASITPDSAVVGATIDLHGSGFGSFNDSCKVLFGTRSFTDVISWTDTLIRMAVPELPESTYYVKIHLKSRESNLARFKPLAAILPLIQGFQMCGPFFHAAMIFNGKTTYQSALGGWAKLRWTGTGFTGVDSNVTDADNYIITQVSGEMDASGRLVKWVTYNGTDHWKLNDSTAMENRASTRLENIPIAYHSETTVRFTKQGSAILDSGYVVSATSVTSEIGRSGTTVTSTYQGVDRSANMPMDVSMEFDKTGK